MAHLYPSLQERFKTEGLCPICFMNMRHMPTFSCPNDHTICQSCRPYYYSCPQCFLPLVEMPPRGLSPPSACIMPHPAQHTQLYPTPSAPDLQEFYDQERGRGWCPPVRPPVYPPVQPIGEPSKNQELITCPYAYLGCTAKFVFDLREMHVSRCQYKHLENEERQPCKYSHCNVCLPHDRLLEHQEICIYKDYKNIPESEDLEDLEQREHCRYPRCNVSLPHDQLLKHQLICIYKDRDNTPEFEERVTLEERLPCKYPRCNVRLPQERLIAHEKICIYKDNSEE